MKKVLLFALVLLIGIAFVSTGFAQEKAKPAPAAEKKAPAPEKTAPDKPAAEKAEPVKEEKPAADTEKPAAEKPKPKPMAGFVGKVTMTDSVFKTVSVERGKQVVTFDVSDAKFKGYKAADNITVGDKVAMVYKKGGLTVTKIAGAKKAKAAKKEGVAKPKKEKTEAATDEQKPADEKKPAKKAKSPAPKKEEKKEEAK
ncbi:MAG: hypothetical protein H6Q52_769 [Deltaproteobacteria bacterium]|nr:hypothetical protein [Deltaproteobacteria bacterium]